MKRPTEAQLMFPLLSITFDPLSPSPVIVEIQMDWGLTGEVNVKYITHQSLLDLMRVLEFASNAVADEIHQAEEYRRQAKAVNENSPPF